MQLRIPGPTPLPPQIIKAMQKPMINHRGSEFAKILTTVKSDIQTILETKNDVFFFPSSGTGMMEAAIVNMFSSGDSVLVLSVGFFGLRFAEIAKKFSLTVDLLEVPAGQGVDLEVLTSSLEKKKYRAILVTHNETSTAVLNDLEKIGHLAGEYETLLVVDAVSSLGITPLPMDHWHSDVIISASQKGLMSPPGIGIIALSPKAWTYYEQSKLPKFYWDIKLAKKYMDKGQTPTTPPVSIMYALETALDLLFQEGLDNVYDRHVTIKKFTHDYLLKLELKLLTDENVASPGLTAFYIDNASDIRQKLEKKDVYLAEGQGDLAGKILRLAHMGYVTKKDMEITLKALASELQS